LRDRISLYVLLSRSIHHYAINAIKDSTHNEIENDRDTGEIKERNNIKYTFKIFFSYKIF